MVKITWCARSDKFMSYFAVCDTASGWELAYQLKTWCTQIKDIKAWDLSGMEIPLDKGYAEFVAHRQISYGS